MARPIVTFVTITAGAISRQADRRARRLDDPLSQLQAVAQQCRELRRPARCGLDALAGEPLDERRVGEHRVALGRDPVDDRLRRTGRRERAAPGVSVEAG